MKQLFLHHHLHAIFRLSLSKFLLLGSHWTGARSRNTSRQFKIFTFSKKFTFSNFDPGNPGRVMKYAPGSRFEPPHLSVSNSGRPASWRIWGTSPCAWGCRSGAGLRRRCAAMGRSCCGWWSRGPENRGSPGTIGWLVLEGWNFRLAVEKRPSLLYPNYTVSLTAIISMKFAWNQETLG